MRRRREEEGRRGGERNGDTNDERREGGRDGGRKGGGEWRGGRGDDGEAAREGGAHCFVFFSA